MESSDIEAEIAGLAIERLVLGSSIPAPSFRAIAREARVTHSTIAEWFGSKDSMLRRCGLGFACRHRAYLSNISARHGVAGLASPGMAASDSVRHRSFWVAWARATDGALDVVDAIHRSEREVVRSALISESGTAPTADEVERLHGAVVGSWDLGVSLLNLPNVRNAS